MLNNPSFHFPRGHLFLPLSISPYPGYKFYVVQTSFQELYLISPPASTRDTDKQSVCLVVCIL